MNLKLYFITLPIYIALDLLWVGLIANNFYKSQIGNLMADKPNWAAIIIFYLIFTAGLVFFVINPAILKNSQSYAFLVGALFGLMTYGTYDLINLALIKNWPLPATLIDLAWGIAVCSIVSGLSFLASSKLL